MDEKKALKKFIRELAGHKNFLWFTVMNLIQVRQVKIGVYDISDCTAATRENHFDSVGDSAQE